MCIGQLNPVLLLRCTDLAGTEHTQSQGSARRADCEIFRHENGTLSTGPDPSFSRLRSGEHQLQQDGRPRSCNELEKQDESRRCPLQVHSGNCSEVYALALFTYILCVLWSDRLKDMMHKYHEKIFLKPINKIHNNSNGN